MIKIEIKSSEVSSRSGNSKGRDWHIRSQEAWAHLLERNGSPSPYPQKIQLNLEDDQAPYPVGQYALSDSSLYVGDFGRLQLGRPILVQVKTQAVA
jgi:hypothetical protein